MAVRYSAPEADPVAAAALAAHAATDASDAELAAAAALLIPLSQKGAASGVASLGSDGLVTPAQRAATYGTLASRPSAATAGDRAFYYATDDNGGTLHQVQSAAWVRIGPKGTELAYAESTSDVSGISTVADVTGLLISFTVGSRPVMVEAVCPLVGQVTSTGQPTLFITANPTPGTTYTSKQFPSMAAGALEGGRIMKARFAANSGAVSVKVRASTTAGTVTVFSNSSRKSFIQAIEV